MADDPVRLPTEEELRALPRWAVVAFAARCARRVQPLFTHFWPKAPREHIEAVDRAISLTQASAADPSSVSTYEVRAAADYVDDAYVAATAADIPEAAYATSPAANAAHAAAADADSAFLGAFLTARAARAADAVVAMRRDYELLRAAAASEGWTDDTPVPPEFFGPLWPEGEPEGWPTNGSENEPVYTKIEIVHPAGLSEERSNDFNKKVAAFFAELSALHVAMGGTGLRLLDRDSLEEILLASDVPQHQVPTTGGVC
jgi:hypothetical protein